MTEPNEWTVSLAGVGGYCIQSVREPGLLLFGFSTREYAEDAVLKLNALARLALSAPTTEGPRDGE